jgi:hypothetical protein
LRITKSDRCRSYRTNPNFSVANRCLPELERGHSVVACERTSAHAEKSRQAARPANSDERASEAFGVLAGVLARDEYESMLSQWKAGLREIWLDNGFVMMRYTPAPG